MHDLVIRGGTVVDGTSSAPFLADVAIDGDRVSLVGTVTAEGREEIDATGKFVTRALSMCTPIMTGRQPGMTKWRPRAGMVSLRS